MFHSLDLIILQASRHLVGASRVTDWIVIFFAEYLIYVLVALFFYFLWKDPRGHKIYFLAVAVLATILSRGILTELIRAFFFRPRPFVALGFNSLIPQSPFEASFPSGHIAFLIPISLTMWCIDRIKGSWFIFLTLLIGVARVAVGVHYPSDILGAILVGAVSFLLVKPFLRKAY